MNGQPTVRSRDNARLRRRLARRVVWSWLLWMSIVAVDYAGLLYIAGHHAGAVVAIQLGAAISAGYITTEKGQQFGRTLGWW